jgi:hypothetical protein
VKKYKAISLKQPWANLVFEGRKTIETRKWKTNYRGDIVICSSKSPKIKPAGFALCIVELYHIEPMKKEHEKKACVKTYPGAYSWFLKNLRKFEKPYPVKGSLGLYTIHLSPDKMI